jgi:hypothetical protein
MSRLTRAAVINHLQFRFPNSDSCQHYSCLSILIWSLAVSDDSKSKTKSHGFKLSDQVIESSSAIIIAEWSLLHMEVETESTTLFVNDWMSLFRRGLTVIHFHRFRLVIVTLRIATRFNSHSHFVEVPFETILRLNFKSWQDLIRIQKNEWKIVSVCHWREEPTRWTIMNTVLIHDSGKDSSFRDTNKSWKWASCAWFLRGRTNLTTKTGQVLSSCNRCYPTLKTLPSNFYFTLFFLWSQIYLKYYPLNSWVQIALDRP